MRPFIGTWRLSLLLNVSEVFVFASTVRRALRVLPLATALPLAVLRLVSAGPAQASTVPGWYVQTVLSTGTGSQGILLDVSSDAPGDAWAAGVVIPSGNSGLAPLITRWNGTAWSQVALPASALTLLGPAGLIGAVSAASPRNVWAFAESSVWLHYDGTTWTSGQLAKPGPSGQVLVAATLALSKSDVWAFGARERSSGAHAYAAHFNGVKWTATSVPGTSPIVSSSAVRAGDVWAVEGVGAINPGSGRGALVHWSGGSWHSVSLPRALAGRALSSVVARSDSDVWVGGAVTNRKKGTTEAVEHWNGRTWTVTALPAVTTSQKYTVTGLASDGHGGLWATATCETCSGNVPSRVWHESARTWRRAVVAAKNPVAIAAMALAPHTTSVWGVGAVEAGKAASALIALDGNPPR
jgi:hypothetical protein